MARGILQGIGGSSIDTDGLTATPDRVLFGDTYIGAGSDDPQTGAIPIKNAENYMPGVSNIVLPPGQYLGEEQTIFGDPGLTPENIKKGSIVFGVSGAFEGYVPGPLDIYKRGTWADGFNNNFFKVVKLGSGYSDTHSILAFQNDSMKLYRDITSSNPAVVSTKLINFAPYKTLNVVVSYPGKKDSVAVCVFEGLSSYALEGKLASASVYFDGSTNEKTISLNIANISLSGSFSCFINTQSSSGPIYIHRIYFAI